VESKDCWWAENRPAAPDLFTREFRDTLVMGNVVEAYDVK
jgi:hypothetical protein